MRSLFVAATVALSLIYAANVLAAGESTQRLDLGLEDIELAAFEENIAWLKLTPGASDELRSITMLNQGSWLEITVEGIEAMKIRIFAVIDSSVIRVTGPSAELRAKLEDIR